MKTLKHLDIGPVEGSSEDIRNLLVWSPKLRFLHLGLGFQDMRDLFDSSHRTQSFRLRRELEEYLQALEKTISDVLQDHKARNPDFEYLIK